MRKFVDVSNNNGSVDFKAIKAAGAFGVYLKVSEGTNFADPTYKERYAEAKAAGLQVGGYHFAHPKNDPAVELEFFLSLLKLEKGDLKPALDLEVNDDEAPARVHSFAARFLSGLERRTGELPVLYSGSPFMRANVLDVLPARKWIPSYGARPADYRWDAWQFSDGQPVYAGAIERVDTSYAISPALLTYKAPIHKRVVGHGKKGSLRLAIWLMNHKPHPPKWAWKKWFCSRFPKHSKCS